jgi:hypothetical protein
MTRFGLGLLMLGAVVGPAGMQAGRAAGQEAKGMDATQWIQTVVAHESEAAQHKGHYVYLSDERSERTGGHLWTERVAETSVGKVRYLLAEDGRPLTGDRLAAEKARVEDEAARPEVFRQKEAARADDEQHAIQMLKLLPKAFLFDAPKVEGELVRVGYRPNPDYSPNGLEERVLHSMVGSVLIDEKLVRVRGLDGKIPEDVNIGFGILATIHAGSNFSTTREHLEGVDWKTQTVHTDINGKALFLKSIARQQEAKHHDFRRIADGMSLTDAVKMLEEEKPLVARE